jgi:hypothetical protein
VTHPALALLIGPEFDEFLCAPIGDDRNGTGLSVLSALARLNVDPWQEAMSLALMPREAAVVRLAALIDTLPNGVPLVFLLRLPLISSSCCRGTIVSMPVLRFAYLYQPANGRRRSSWR